MEGLYSKLASAIYNDLHAGLKGMSNEWTIPIEQIEDTIVDVRAKLLETKLNEDIRLMKVFSTSLGCIKVDCSPIENCPECMSSEIPPSQILPHFKIPQPLFSNVMAYINYIGTTDMQESYAVFTDFERIKALKYKRVPLKKPYVFLNTAPDSDGNIHGYIFNAPYVREITVVGVFRDLRSFFEDSCCDFKDNSDSLNAEIHEYILKLYANFYSKMTQDPTKQPII